MNKQSNTYTIAYIVLVVLVVGTLLALTSMSLRPRQQANRDADKMRQILSSVHLVAEKGQSVTDLFNSSVVEMLTVDTDGNVVKKSDKFDAEIFNTDIAAQSKADADKRVLPVYVCRLADGAMKYIVPMSGNGLWGPIWGYLAIDADGSTIYGAYFSHEGETPGLGAEIEKPDFQSKFDGKHLIQNGKFAPIVVVKAGQHPNSDVDFVNGISGGTITSKGVGSMLDNCLQPYAAFFSKINQPSENQ